MTEDEAKTKWCPFGRGTDGQNRGQDDDGNEAAYGACIASDCMAWRWKSTNSYIYGDGTNFVTESYSDTEGYCGLAGKQ